MELKDLIWNMTVHNSDPTGNVNKDFETVDNFAIPWLGQRNDLPFSQVYPTDYAVLCGARLTDENCGPFIKKVLGCLLEQLLATKICRLKEITTT